MRVRAGTPVDELHAALRRAGATHAARRARRHGRRRRSTVGENDIHMLGRGTLRSSVLQIRYVSAEGRIVNGGGPTVKNVTGFDLPRLFVGSLGTLGLLAEVILRTNPIPAAIAVARGRRRRSVRRVSTPCNGRAAVLWNGDRTWVLLEGHRADIDAERAVLGRLAAFERGRGTTDPAIAPMVAPAGRSPLARIATRRRRCALVRGGDRRRTRVRRRGADRPERRRADPRASTSG